MTLETLHRLLGWCTLINYGILTLWFLLFLGARDWIYRFHGRWFRLSPEQFDALHYGGMTCYKLLVIVFNLTPWLALLLIG